MDFGKIYPMQIGLVYDTTGWKDGFGFRIFDWPVEITILKYKSDRQFPTMMLHQLQLMPS